MSELSGNPGQVPYTPTTEEVRNDYVCALSTTDIDDAEAGFDRWLAEVIRKAKEEAWDEGWVSETFAWNPYRQGETE